MKYKLTQVIDNECFTKFPNVQIPILSKVQILL